MKMFLIILSVTTYFLLIPISAVFANTNNLTLESATKIFWHWCLIYNDH